MHGFDAHIHPRQKVAGCLARPAGNCPKCHGGGICCAASHLDWDQVASLARKFACLTPAFGLHPWFAGQWSDKLRHQLIARLDANPGALVGEVGLDLAGNVAAPVQQRVLLEQVGIASRLHRPLVLHSVKAWGPTLDLLRQWTNKLPAVMIHEFNGSLEVLDQCISLGIWISFGPRATAATSRRARLAVAAVPDNHLLCETDGYTEGCPATIGQPVNLSQVLRQVAMLRRKDGPLEHQGKSPAELAALCAGNASRFVAGLPPEGYQA